MPQEWIEAKGKRFPVEEKQCEAENCLNKFLVEWQGQRRCKRCRREKRQYRKENNPF